MAVFNGELVFVEECDPKRATGDDVARGEIDLKYVGPAYDEGSIYNNDEISLQHEQENLPYSKELTEGGWNSVGYTATITTLEDTESILKNPIIAEDAIAIAGTCLAVEMLLAKLKPTNSTAKVLLETEAAAKEDGLFDEYIFEPYLFAQSISNNKRLVRRLYIARYRYDGGYQSYFGYTPDHTQDKTDAFIEIDTNKLPEDKWQTIEKARQAIDDALIKTTRRPHPTNTY